MKTAATREALRSALDERAAVGRPTVGFVPTMGALHEGHAALFRRAHSDADVVVASIFVNPLQFGPGEDLDRYPRTLEADLAMCAELGVDVVFTPTADVVYPGGDPLVTVDPGPLASVLEGASRPGHFRGVLTVVAKLFNLVRPDVAVFGDKDYQQLVLIRQMARDLCMPIDVVGAPTVRQDDGLAVSSRNRYLSDDDRPAAVALSRALLAGQAAGREGPNDVLAAATKVLVAEPAVTVDYLVLRGTDLGEPPAAGEARLLVAAKVGTTRLIDNVAVQLGPGVPGEGVHA